MNDKYKNRYRTDSNRCTLWDYSSPGSYFLTLKIKNNAHILGKIVKGKMILSKLGEIVQSELSLISEYHTNATLDESIVMPNHVHMIITIADVERIHESNHEPQRSNDVERSVKRIHEFSLPTPHDESLKQNRKSRCKMIIPRILGKFKMLTSKRINELNETPGIKNWQYNYHDHIIHNQDSYYRIKRYIQNNPRNWKDDKFYK